MGLTNIGDQKTPGRPSQISFGPNTGLPSANQEITLVGHLSTTGGSVPAYTLQQMTAVADAVAALTEAQGYFGVGSELALMVQAAVQANQQGTGSTFPNIKCVALANGDTGFGTADIALTVAERYKAEFLVSPYDSSVAGNITSLKTAASLMSGAQRVDNGQYGTIGVYADRKVSAPGSLPKSDTQFLSPVTLRDATTGVNGPALSVGQLAASYAAILAANVAPFNPVDRVVIPNVVAPFASSDWYTVGAGMDSESILNQGWTPLRVLPNGSVAIVRSVTARVTVGDGITAVNSYYDVQDFQVLYFWRKTLATRFAQPDMSNIKASHQAADLILSEVIRLASTFEEQGMFQNVSGLAKLFVVARSLTDRSRFDIFTPVNVVPGLHVIASNLQASTIGDILSI